MYNMLKNKMSSMIFHNFKKNSYKQISNVSGKEEIYLRDNKMVILVEDENVGNRLYDLVKTLKECGETISSEHVEIKITNYVATKYNTVQIIFADVNFNFENNWDQCSDLDKLQEMVSFESAMREKGYYLDESVFDNESCTNISDFLSFFKTNGSEIEKSNGCIIKYIHYVLSSGGKLDEYYEPIVKENKICAVSDFPYCMPIIKLCYNYYVNAIIPTNIISIIKEERREEYYGKNLKLYKNYLVVGQADLSSNLAVIEDSDQYTVYEGYIKIYKQISHNFEEFLEDDDGFIRKAKNYGYVEECLANTIINYDGKIIGYKYSINKHTQCYRIVEHNFNSQIEIIALILRIRTFIVDVVDKTVYPQIDGKDDFELETNLNWLPGNNFNVDTISDLYNLVTCDSNIIAQKITKLFFKLLNTYLEKQYGKLTDKKELFEKKEVRYLSPVIAKEFIKFVQGKKVAINTASSAFYAFLDSGIRDDGSGVAYNPIFKNNSAEGKAFSFDYEIESKYGITLEKNIRIQLPDNRTLVTFQKRKSLSAIEKKINSVKKEIKDKISLNSRYIKLVEISEIIYSLDLNSEDMYQVVGYIVPEIKGEKITEEMVLGFSNREMVRFAGKLISNFKKYYINWDSIFINIIPDNDNTNKDFEFFINILDENFSIESYYARSELSLVEDFFEYLKNRGYNKNAFIGLNSLSSYNLQRDLISYADSFDAYCEEHKIYYDSEELLCPVCKKTRIMITDKQQKSLKKVMEDDYAIHYFCGSVHYNCGNVKIYKSDFVDIKVIEKSIDSMLEKLQNTTAISAYMQECFLPYKKVLNERREFIGYLYNTVNFDDEKCCDLADVEKLENLARIKSLIRLISQVITLVKRNYSFVSNPFSHVFLNKNYTKQVQILNIDLLTKKPNYKKTVRWTCEYVRQIIKADSNIQIDISKLSSNNLDTILKALENLAKNMTMYCPIHKMFYSNDYLFCPKCISAEQMEKMEIEYVDASDIAALEEFNNGGESIIYYYDNGKLAKVFRDEINLDFKKKILAAIFSKKEILEKINQENHKFKYIIPGKLLIDRKERKIIGYTMDKKVEGEPISSLSAKDFVEENELARQDILEILITVGEGIETLHDKTNIYIGDLNGRNILFDKDKNVYFLDFDGMGFEDIHPLFFTDEYIDPVSKANNSVTKDDDWYSLAVQTFHYLTYTHPFEGICYEDEEDLDTVDRMERRISLLGNHGIEPPRLAKPWTWMSKELKNILYNIFEKELRINFVNALKKQYNELYGQKYQIDEEVATNTSEDNSTAAEDAAKDASEVNVTMDEEAAESSEEIIRLNSKFIAKVISPFNCNVERIINQYSAICKDDDNYYVIINTNGKDYKVNFSNPMEIIDIMILENLEIAVAVYRDLVSAYDMQNNQELLYEVFNYSSDFVTVNDDTIYLTKKYNRENIILQVEFDSNKNFKSNKIRFLSECDTKGFLVKFNSKFMLVKRNESGTDEIYCNSEKLCDIDDSDFMDSKYNILYDDVTKLWLIVNSKGNYITIKSSNGHHEKVNVPIVINNIRLENTYFDKGVLYIPSQDCVYIVNAKSGIAKRMECDKIITPNSHLYNFNSSGFNAITDKKVYEVTKI